MNFKFNSMMNKRKNWRKNHINVNKLCNNINNYKFNIINQKKQQEMKKHIMKIDYKNNKM